MEENELLEAISKMMDEKLQPINVKLEKMQEDISTLKDDVDILKEDSAITRNASNTLLDWAEKVQVQVQIPLFKKAE